MALVSSQLKREMGEGLAEAELVSHLGLGLSLSCRSLFLVV